MDEEGNQFVAYFLPVEETLRKRKRDQEEEMDYAPEDVYGGVLYMPGGGVLYVWKGSYVVGGSHIAQGVLYSLRESRYMYRLRKKWVMPQRMGGGLYIRGGAPYIREDSYVCRGVPYSSEGPI